jgi:S1-C subfamily serine protease
MTSRAIPFLLFLLLCPLRAAGDKIYITSEPPGAHVEIEGHAGTTPWEMDFPGGYFHEPRTLLSTHLSRPLVARLTLEGYEDKEVVLTLGPREWVSNNGHKRFQYFVFGSTHFHVQLKRPSEPDTETVEVPALRKMAGAAETDQAGMIERSKPAVVHLHGPVRNGSGFFVTKEGVIATNAHVARGQGALFADLSDGNKLEADTICIDPTVDVAFLKVKGRGFHPLRLAETQVRPGEEVFAIGSPGGAMPFSITKGIVSALGLFANLGPGTWIQTDAAINSGTSGGPLLNVRGEVAGMITQKVVKDGMSGIGFAQSATDVVDALKRCDERLAVENMAEEKPPDEDSGLVEFSGPAGAQIWVDNLLVGVVPATLPIRVGRHRVRVAFRGQVALWRRDDFYMLKGAYVRLTVPPPSQPLSIPPSD